MVNKQFKRGTNMLNDMAAQCVQDTDRWFGDKPHVNTLLHQTLGMCGEAGEFANVVKKIDKGQLNIDNATTKVRLAEELADVLTYVLSISGLLHIDLEKAYVSVRAKNQHRFMEGKK